MISIRNCDVRFCLRRHLAAKTTFGLPLLVENRRILAKGAK
jgi:hypothetical protein